MKEGTSEFFVLQPTKENGGADQKIAKEGFLDLTKVENFSIQRSLLFTLLLLPYYYFTFFSPLSPTPKKFLFVKVFWGLGGGVNSSAFLLLRDGESLLDKEQSRALLEMASARI